VFQTNNTVDNIWIGAKYNNNKIKWFDNSTVSFTNWAEKNPKNNSSDNCIQMVSEETSVGKWVNEPCNKNNRIVCQKIQTWSLYHLQKTFLQARKELENSLENVKKNPVPLGFIYVQLPNEKSPKEIWPWMLWNDVSSAYAGIFFRVAGGNASSFGQIQEENSPRLIHVSRHLPIHQARSEIEVNVFSNGEPSVIIDAERSVDRDIGLQFTVSDGEVRPRNMAIRIWKRNG